ncbi:hypothetical protein CLAIMM_02473 [Cladophialophora immunda]|nr:hypothetical protein CLAIMM_02473 [Cladophialophora immunda]
MSATSGRYYSPCFSRLKPVATPDPEKLSAHEREYRYFVAAQRLRRQVADHLAISADGWVPEDAWGAEQLQHRQLYSNVVQAITSTEDPDHDAPIKSERELKAIWRFDL